MLDATDSGTITNIYSLVACARRRDKPLVLWVGAGASAWAGYSLWPTLADTFHSSYLRHEPDYDRGRAASLLAARDFPAFFQHCRDACRTRYYTLLTQAFHPRETPPVYHRFIASISRLKPLAILTTNIDEALEQHLGSSLVLQRTDLARAPECMRSAPRCICKMHGTVSAIESCVFTTSDYTALVEDARFLAVVGQILSRSHVLFVGYGLADAYVLRLMAGAAQLNEVLGDGPHFAIVPGHMSDLPPNIKCIRYVPSPHKDHRSQISVIDEVATATAQAGSPQYAVAATGLHTSAVAQRSSAHLLADIFPPGAWHTSVQLGLEAADGSGGRDAIVGSGFTQEELPDDRSTAMHDLLVGLLCFDAVYASITAVPRVHDLVGGDLFWDLVRQDVLRFIDWRRQESVLFPDQAAVSGGDLGSFELYSPDMRLRTADETVRRCLKPVTGKEREADALISTLVTRIRTIEPDEEGAIPAMTRGLLLRPSVRRLLGVSGGTPVNSLARWQMYPVLRLANAVKLGSACRVLGIASTKLDYGMASLSGPAFASVVGTAWTDDAASFILAGRYGVDIGHIALADATHVRAVMRFRDTSVGERTRREILERLAAADGGEVAAAVNGAMREGLAPGILQSARDQFIQLYTSPSTEAKAPCLWNDRRYADDGIVRWRARSRRLLEQHCTSARIGLYDECPCGSREKLKYCCREALAE